MNIDTIICGDNATVLTSFNDECIDLTVTSPPYDNLRTYNGFTWNFEALAGHLYRVTKPGGVVVWVVSDKTENGSETGTSFKQALYFKEIGFNLHDTMIYEKDSFAMPVSNRYYQTFEFMFVFSKGTPAVCNLLKIKTKHGPSNSSRHREADGTLRGKNSPTGREFRARGSVWSYGVGFSKSTLDEYAFSHPAMFPESLARDHILSWSNPGDIVLDPFIGSGTTAKMAKETGRHWIGIDISDEYCRLAQRRVMGANVPLPFFSQVQS